MPKALTSGPLMLRLFGPFEAFVNGRLLSHPRAQAGEWILTLLALHRTRPVERNWLASLFWPDSSHEQALYNLRRNLTDVRRLLGSEASRLTSPTARTLHLELDTADCDVLSFDALIQNADTTALQQAVALYRGPLLAPCEEAWAVQERTTRENAYLSALETLAARAAQQGDHSKAISLLRQVLAIDSYREAALCSLLQSHAACGDLAEATLAYREFRLRLHDELQTEPASETQAVYRSLRRCGRHRTAASSLPSAIPPSAPPLHVPQPLSGFIGRQGEIREVRACLKRVRLVTLTGAGGVGKTRLAIAAAEEMADDFQDGIWFVDLAPLSEAALVPFTIAVNLGLIETPDHSAVETLLGNLASKEMLLILDNCEHLLEACVSITHTLLQVCPALRIVVTSRQALGLSGELVWRVPSLAFPADEEREPSPTLAAGHEQCDAVHLFAERARESCPSFTLHPRNAATVARICRLLDGIPLAIELAAARMRSLPLHEICTRLRTDFRLLRGGAGTLPRQETLAAAFAWSWDLLDPSERLLLAQLSVFSGGWTLAAAEAICTPDCPARRDVLDLLPALVDKSLVVYVPPETESQRPERKAREARYYLLETTRRFAAERLAENGGAETVRNRHRDHFLTWAEEIRPYLWSPEPGPWFERLETEHHNLRSALERCRDQDAVELQCRFMAALSRFWDTYGHLREGYDHLVTTLARVKEVQTELHADVLVNAGWMAHVLGDMASSRGYYERALALSRQIGSERHLPGLFNLLASHYSYEGDFARAHATFEEANRQCLLLDKPRVRVAVLNNLGESLLRHGETREAQRYLEEGTALCREIGARQMLGVTLNNLAIAAWKQGRCQDAFVHNASSLQIFHESCTLVNIPASLDLMAVLDCRQNQWERVACLLGAAEKLHGAVGGPPENILISDLDEACAAARHALGAEAFDADFTRGAAMTIETVVAYALSDAHGAAK